MDKDTALLSKTVVRLPSLQFWENVTVLVAFLALFARLLTLIARYAVNIFFMDQWDFNEATVFQKHTLWEMFRFQHGPHRQGLGALVSYLIEPYFKWDSRSDSFLAGIVILLAALCAIWLKIRLFGKLSIFDVCIPLILFTSLQYEAVIVSANLSQGPLPLLLILLYCIAWTAEWLPLRYVSVLLINFVTIHTGYGFFLGAITPVALVLDYWLRLRRHLFGKIIFAFSLLLSLASLGIFFMHYVFTTEVDCTPNLFVSPWSYIRFLLLIFANLFGVKGTTFVPLLVGALTLVAMLVALTIAARKVFSMEPAECPKHWTVLILISFCLVFGINAAYGRSCLGPQVAQVSRYIIWMEPGLLGLFLFLQTIEKAALRKGLLLLLTAAFLATVPVRNQDEAVLRFVTTAKRNWKACYLQIEDIRTCNHVVGYGVYPDMTHNFASKLEFLKHAKLNLYAPPE